METKKAKMVVIVLALALLHLLPLSAKSQDEPRIPISSVPYTISSSESYYLTKNLQTTSGSQNAITVNADNVTIDLMGFSLIGRGSGTGRGIYMNGRSNVEIRNGTVRNFGREGIYEASVDDGDGHRVISVRALFNGGAGIKLSDPNNLVRDCTTLANGNDGIYVGPVSMVTNNISSDNGDDGIELDIGCMASGNVISYNKWHGIWTFFGCAVFDNVSYENGRGIVIQNDGNFVKDNTLRRNVLSNIYVKGTDNIIEANSVTSSGYGIYFEGCGNFYAYNRAADNTDDYYNIGCQTDGGGNVSF
ncbi:MAG: right-handed parallel beta-helix repeat-containing protein [Phycisphaerae bacterium]